jgi:choline dehydrogenase-like flavoprotein
MENHYDLIVVGTGFASSFFLKKYLEKTEGHKSILVLERGVFYPHSARLEAKRGHSVAKFSNLPPPDQTFIFKNRDKKSWVFDPNFGGSSNCWVACTPRFMPDDFKIRTLYDVGQDWPISYDEIEPYYCEAEDTLGVGGPDITPFPKSRKYPLPPQHLSTVDKLIQQKYGSLFISQPTARATISIGKRNACCSSCVCQLCPVDSKFTIENTLFYLYEQPNITLKYNSQVHNLRIENNQVKSVIFRNNGRDYEVYGDLIVLGANPIFNSHILLSAGDQSYYTGRGLCEQRGTYARLFFENLDNVGGSSIITANGYMLYNGIHRKEYAACLIENNNNIFIRNDPGKWRKMAMMKFIFEDIPNDNNRVLLSEDPLKPKLEYKGHDPYVDRAMARLEENIKKTFSFLPIEKIEMDGFFQKTEFHICSTTRMSSTIDNGVVDRNLMHHKYRNLFVLGSGVFPSITPANPTLTLSALSLMAVDHTF